MACAVESKRPSCFLKTSVPKTQRPHVARQSAARRTGTDVEGRRRSVRRSSQFGGPDVSIAMQVSPTSANARQRNRPNSWRRGALRPQPQGRASKTILNGVSVALRTLPKPPCVIADESLAKPACAPSAAPTGWSSEVGMQIMVEAA